MTDKPKRSRGRPRGSGRNDTPLLRQVAELMASDTKLKKTAAIRRVFNRADRGPGEMESTFVRRLQHKWTVQGKKLLEEVHMSRANKVSDAAAYVSPHVGVSRYLVGEYARMIAQAEIARLSNPFPPSFLDGSCSFELHSKQLRQWMEMQRAAEEAMKTQRIIEDAMRFQRAAEEATRVQDIVRRMHSPYGF